IVSHMLMCLEATSTPLPGTGPRTSRSRSAKTFSPQKLSALQRRDIHTVTLRGSASAGRKPTASTTETSANQMKKIAERSRVTEATESGRVARLALVAAVVKQRHHQAGKVFHVF